MAETHTLLGRALGLACEAMAPIVHRELRDHGNAGKEWPEKLVLPALSDMSVQKFRDELARRRAGAMKQDDYDALLKSLEPQDLARVMRQNLDCFPQQRGRNRNLRTLLSGLIDLRNDWAHFDQRLADPITAASRLGQVYELLTALGDTPRAAEVRTLITTLNAPPAVLQAPARSQPLPETIQPQPKPEASKTPKARRKPRTAAPSLLVSSPPRIGEGPGERSLPPWREVAMPNADVAEGTYRRAEFAADLSQVVARRATVEYQDPGRFFQRTFLTGDMRRLLVHALHRLATGDGDPVIQLKTSFGGGKTHTLIALYHLAATLATPAPPDEVAGLLAEAELTAADVGKPNVAVFVGIGPTAAGGMRDVPELGVQVNTLWGEIAYQLGGAAGLKLVLDEDQLGLPPGSEKLHRLLNEHAPALILIDEFVAFVRQLRGARNPPAGSFEANLTFMQQLTEAVKATPRALLVATIPESDVELGGQAGEEAKRRIEKAFERISISYEPVKPEDGFEVVRRRLFDALAPEDIARRDQVCEAFGEAYRRNRSDLPREASEPAYLERLRECYPVHPELFDRLYQDWSTLANFQRTRGVLRLMAAVIHALWQRGDRSPLIMPGSLPLDDPAVRAELLTYLSEQWGAVIDKDVAGEGSEPKRMDDARPLWGRYQACQRAARAVFLGSPPQKSAPGVEDTHVLLGVLEPDQSAGTYRETLVSMRSRLAYLYASDTGRYWFAVQPNLNRTVADRAEKVQGPEVWRELEGRLKRLAGSSHDFGGVHVCPPDSGDVGDQAQARLVVLSPRFAHERGGGTAQAEAQRLLETRGNAPRQYRNMLVFLACDAADREALVDEARRMLAWKSVLDDADRLDLDAGRKRQAANSQRDAEAGVEAKLQNAYRWLLAPGADVQDGGQVRWKASALDTGRAELSSGGGMAARAAAKLRVEDALVTVWAPLHLERWLAQLYFKDGVTHVALQTVWRDLCSYLYFPRLRDEEVLLATVREGMASIDFFGYAQGVRGDGSFVGLVFGRPGSAYLNADAVLVSRDAAVAQIAREKGQEAPQSSVTVESQPASQPLRPGVAEGASQAPPLPAAPPLARRFHGSARLDPLKLSTQAQQIANEIVARLMKPGVSVELTLELKADSEGFSEDVQRVITENARTLKFDSASFEEG
jgi:uncharacterized protein